MKTVSLQLKIIALIIMILVVTMAATLFLTISNQRRGFIEYANRDLTVNTEILHQAIKSIMLSGEAPIAVTTMNNIKTIAELKEVEIYRTDGDVAFSDYSTVDFVNKYQDFIMFEKTSRADRKMTENTFFLKSLETGLAEPHEIPETREIEYFYPIRNEKACWTCHGTADESGAFRGVAHFKISVQGIYDRIAKARFFLIVLFALTGILLALVLIASIQRLIIRPLILIGSTVNQFGEGNLEVMVKLKSNDEFGVLSDKINDMFVRVRERFLLSKFVSRSTDEMIKEGRNLDHEGEKKEITVLFSDIRGFTRYSDSHTPGEVVVNLNQILQIQADIVEKYEGDVDKFVGDEVMAVFNDPFLAVVAAYEMIRRVRQNSEEKNEPLFVGIGINTGDVISGNIGSKSRLEYAVIGDTVNMASRLCGLAKPNMILLSEETYGLVKDQVKARLIANQEVKGKSGPVNFYAVQSIRLPEQDQENEI